MSFSVSVDNNNLCSFLRHVYSSIYVVFCSLLK